MMRLLPNLKLLKALQHNTATPTEPYQATHRSRDTNTGHGTRTTGHGLYAVAAIFSAFSRASSIVPTM